MFERFTPQARAVVTGAQQEARQLGHAHLGTEHLLLAMLASEAGPVATVLHAAGLDRATVRADVVRLVGTAPSILSAEDVAALRSIGIDAAAVLARIEETFGPDALTPPSTGLSGRRRRGEFSRLPVTRRAKKVIELSLREARALHHDYIGAEHLLLGLLRDGDGDGPVARILTDRGVDLDRLRRSTVAAMDQAA